jgi:hypothetical protein
VPARLLRPFGSWLLRLLTAAALAVDAYVHADLATRYDPNRVGAEISQGDLFRVHAAAAALAALAVMLSARRLVWAFAALVAAAGLLAVLLYRYADPGAIGSLPDMREPAWYPEKTLTTIAEAAATVAALLGWLIGPTHRRGRIFR